MSDENKKEKPQPLIRGVLEGGCIIERYDFSKKREKAEVKPKRGEPLFLICPICHDENAAIFPIVQTDSKGQTHINHLMCASGQCKGNTVLDVHRGVISHDVRILEEE